MDDLDALLDGVPGTASVWLGRPGAAPAYTREPDATHYAASTMKAAVLGAIHLRGLPLDTPVRVVNDFASAATGRFGCQQSYDNDDAVWERLGDEVELGWLAQRMIVRSSNLATNLVLDVVGKDAVAEFWRLVGARHSVVGRGIEDGEAREAGITNLVTAADLAALFGAVTLGRVPGAAAMLDVLLAQEGTEDLASGLPAGTRVAHKNGWIEGIRHGAGVVFPDDAPPFVVAVCLTTPLAVNDADDEACGIVAQVAAAAWAARRQL